MPNETVTTPPATDTLLSTATAYFVLTEGFTRHRASRKARAWVADSDRAIVALYHIPHWVRGMMPHEQIQFRAGSTITTRPAPAEPATTWEAWANADYDAPKDLLIFNESDVIARPRVEYPEDSYDACYRSLPTGRLG